MSARDLAGALEALARGELTPTLYDELRRSTRALVLWHRYPPSYSPSGTWDEDAYDEVVDDWILHRLRDLTRYAADQHHFWRVVERSLGQFIVNLGRRTVSRKIYRSVERAVERNRDFARRADGLWGLRGWKDDRPAFSGLQATLLRCLPDSTGAVTKGGYIRSTWVEKACMDVCACVGEWLRLAHLAEVIRVALHASRTLGDPDDVELGLEEDVSEADEVSVELLVLERVAATEVLACMSAREKAALWAYFQGDRTVTAVARALGGTLPDARGVLASILHLISAHAPSQDSLERMMDILAEYLHLDGE